MFPPGPAITTPPGHFCKGQCMYGNFSNVRNVWGSLFGLSPKDLTIGQLKSLKFEKLIECIESDPRIPHMIAARLPGENFDAISYMSKLPNEIMTKYPNIIYSYNRYIDNNIKRIESNKYSRNHVIIWNMLEERHKKYEVDAWFNKRQSVITEYNIDYEWLRKNHPYEAKIKISGFIDKMKSQEYNKHGWGFRGINHMISNVSAEYIDLVCATLFDKKNNTISSELKLMALSNKNLSAQYTVLALKIGSKRLYWPTVEAKITKDILKKLATITRLNVIEKLIALASPIYGIEDETDFRTLMFGSIMRYPERVERAVKRFNRINPKEIAQ